MNNINKCLVGIALLATIHMVHAAGACSPAIKAGPGKFPLDYNDPENKGHILYLVETIHFTPQVEQLTRGATSNVGGDLSYVLNAYPNHPRALNAMARLAEKENTTQPSGAAYPIDCYFDRAINFAPSDPIPPLLYGNYLSKKSLYDAALEKYKQAEKIDPQNTNVLYNMGLLYFKTKQYDDSLAYAKKAYAAGFPLPGLRQQLESSGHWKDD
jgi:hypothetical protein